MQTREERKSLHLSPEIIRFFQGFVRAVTSAVRAVVQAVTKHIPEIQAIVERKIAQDKQAKRLAYRKKRSQAKNWRRWRRKRRH